MPWHLRRHEDICRYSELDRESVVSFTTPPEDVSQLNPAELKRHIYLLESVGDGEKIGTERCVGLTF